MFNLARYKFKSSTHSRVDTPDTLSVRCSVLQLLKSDLGLRQTDLQNICEIHGVLGRGRKDVLIENLLLHTCTAACTPILYHLTMMPNEKYDRAACRPVDYVPDYEVLKARPALTQRREYFNRRRHTAANQPADGDDGDVHVADEMDATHATLLNALRLPNDELKRSIVEAWKDIRCDVFF